MKKPLQKLFIKPVILLIAALILSSSCNNGNVSWPEPTIESKPWTRWWWPGNAVDSVNISRELQEMAAAGIGGVEITSIYGVQGEDHRNIEFLTPEFSDILKFTVKEAKRLGMGVDMPPGSGWRCGGPFVPEEKGLWSLKMNALKVKAGEVVDPAGFENGEAFSFVDETGKVTVLDAGVNYTAPSAGTVYIATRVKNGDRVKRASDGGKGWAIDTFDEEITEWYFNEFWNRMKLDDALVRCFFHDSFEYSGDFTPRFTEEFRKRRGYDLAEVLHVLAGDIEENDAIAARVKSDYRETLSDLVLESFIQPMTRWANSHGSLNRNQAHGSPGNVLDLYAACDIPETEIFGRIEPGKVDVFTTKFASSAAHVTGKKLVSSESFTWLDEHWTVSPADMIRAVNRYFLSGVNHIFFHGTCYSPADAAWPGWLFYASSQVNNRNPLWRELPALFKYIERSQSVLQKAEPRADVLVYWPWHDVASSGNGRMFLNLNIDRGDNAAWFSNFAMAEVSQKLTDEGFTFDYISDRQLLNCRMSEGEILTEGNAKYKALVIPETKYMPVHTLQKLAEMVAENGKVFFDNNLPESAPGLYNLEEREKQLKALKTEVFSVGRVGDVTNLLNQAEVPGEISLKQKGFHFQKLNMDNEDWYMVVNTGITSLDEWVELSAEAGSYLLYFPENCEISLAAMQDESVRIQLEPERVVFIRCTDRTFDLPKHRYAEPDMKPQEIEGLWKITFLEGGPVFPGDVSTDNLVSWTQTGDENTARFAGTAKYTAEFGWEGSSAAGLLDLGTVNDCARVRLNGKDYGVLMGPSFKVAVDNLQQGKNLLEVEVTNVAANRIRDLDLRGANWKKFHDINFVNIDYKPFDASSWPVRDSGLLGPVTVAGY